MRRLRTMAVAAGLRPAVEGSCAPDASAVVGMARCAVPARAVAGGTGIRASLALKGVAPLHAARTSQRDVPTRLTRYAGCRHNSFTLVEMIGALAVIAALVAVVVPSVIRRIDRAAWTKETADLSALADSFTQSILRTKTIPSATNWASAVASQMSLPVSTIATNARRYARAFLVDTNLVIGSGLPYTQTTNGTAKPVSGRVMMVSSLGLALPISTGVPTSAEFNAIWNTAEGAKPSTWTNWAGSGDDLRIKKLNLEPLFYQLILVNHSTDSNLVPLFSIDNSSTTAVTAGPLGLNKYYLDGTVVGLHALSTNGVARLQVRHSLKRNISFLFESDWRGQLQGDQQSYSSSGSDFYNHALTFINRPGNPWASSASQEHGASQVGVIMAIYTFMFDYTYWANECPHFDYHGNSANSVPEYVLLNNQGQNNGNVDQFSSSLIYAP